MTNSITVDLGSNATQMLQQLADKLGMTIDTIYPFYVSKVILSGWLGLVFTGVPLLIFLAMFIWSCHLLCKDLENDFKQMASTFFGVFSLVLLLIFLKTGYGSILEILNPDYYAIRELLSVLNK